MLGIFGVPAGEKDSNCRMTEALHPRNSIKGWYLFLWCPPSRGQEAYGLDLKLRYLNVLFKNGVNTTFYPLQVGLALAICHFHMMGLFVKLADAGKDGTTKISALNGWLDGLVYLRCPPSLKPDFAFASVTFSYIYSLIFNFSVLGWGEIFYCNEW